MELPACQGTSNEFSGVVHGPSIQARQIRGDVHIHQPPLPPPGPLPPPFHLPPPGLLLGRDADLQAMEAAQGSRLIVVCGPQGVGKPPWRSAGRTGCEPASLTGCWAVRIARMAVGCRYAYY